MTRVLGRRGGREPRAPAHSLCRVFGSCGRIDERPVRGAPPWTPVVSFLRTVSALVSTVPARSAPVALAAYIWRITCADQAAVNLFDAPLIRLKHTGTRRNPADGNTKARWWVLITYCIGIVHTEQ